MTMWPEIFEAWDIRMYGFGPQDHYIHEGDTYDEKSIEKLKDLAKTNRHWKAVAARYKINKVVEQRVYCELEEEGYIEAQSGLFMKKKDAITDAL